ncbi:MAG: DNA methyltransferase [Gammaproteobacteria bacterium]|nr:DNA methyltransferase [Gammaproteobacteria bacterium]
MNKLYYGDCLTILRDKIPSQSVDLIYLDPPFNSNREYNNIYKDETGRPLPDQVEAFNDTWTLDEERMRFIREMPVLLRSQGVDDQIAEFWRLWMNALIGTNPKLLAYLSYMVERLLYLRSVLKPTGTIYLHCDPTASHYLKIFMDGIFGHKNFRNELVWERIKGHKGNQHDKRNFGKSSDTIFFYSKTDKYFFDANVVALPYEDLQKEYPHTDKFGRYKQRDPFRSPGAGARPNLCYEYKGVSPPSPAGWRIKKERLEQEDQDGLIDWIKGKPYRKQRPGAGVIPNNIWFNLRLTDEEKMDYKTQKPVSLLERIIASSCPKNGLVLDPFCGCGTTMEAAARLERQWIGIDIAIHAVKRVASKRLKDRLRLKEDVDFEIDGVPKTVEGAQDLWNRDKYHFQKWAVEQVDGFVTTKRTADGGIDGRIYFNVQGEEELGSMIIEVKGGQSVNINVLRELKGVLDVDNAVMAGLVVLHPLGKTKQTNFNRFIAEVGDVRLNEQIFSKLQILTVEQILNGERFKTPWVVGKSGERPLSLENV